MSASDANSAIYVTDSAKETKTKVDPEPLLFSWKKILPSNYMFQLIHLYFGGNVDLSEIMLFW